MFRALTLDSNLHGSDDIVAEVNTWVYKLLELGAETTTFTRNLVKTLSHTPLTWSKSLVTGIGHGISVFIIEVVSRGRRNILIPFTTKPVTNNNSSSESSAIDDDNTSTVTQEERKLQGGGGGGGGETIHTRRGMYGLKLSRELIEEIQTNNTTHPQCSTQACAMPSMDTITMIRTENNNTTINSARCAILSSQSNNVSSQRHVLFDQSDNIHNTQLNKNLIPTSTNSSPSPPALPPRPASCRASPQAARASPFDADMLRAVQLKPSASRTKSGSKSRNSRRETMGGNTGPSSMTQALQRALDEKFKGLRGHAYEDEDDDDDENDNSFDNNSSAATSPVVMRKSRTHSMEVLTATTLHMPDNRKNDLPEV